MKSILLIFSLWIPLSGFSAGIGFLRPQVKYGLVGHWTLNEGTGTTSSDASGNNLTSVWTNTPVWTNAIVRTGLNFDGTTQVIAVNSTSTLSPGTNDFSIALWFKTGVNFGAAFSSMVWRYGSSANNLFAIGIAPDNKLFSYYRDNGVNSLNLGTTAAGHGATVNDNSWHHVAWIRVGTYAEKYLDGAYVASVTNSSITNIIMTAGNQMDIGKCSGNANFWGGAMDDIRIYNRALTSAEVKQLYGGGYGSH